MTVWTHSLVKNEERFIWYSLASVIEHVDRALVWDTGSMDNTVRIIKEVMKLYPRKVDFREVGDVNPEQFTKVRQEMLEETKSDWFLIVDGDEIWWEDSIKRLIDTIRDKGAELESIIVPNYYLIGDMYHYQEEAAGKYRLGGREGNLNLRAVNRKIPGLSSANPHGTWGWVDSDGTMIQERSPRGISFLEDAPYLHASFLRRSASRFQDESVPKRAHKLKYEIGVPFPLDFYYPEVFFKNRPAVVTSSWEAMNFGFQARALLQTPLKKVKRRIVRGKVGY